MKLRGPEIGVWIVIGLIVLTALCFVGQLVIAAGELKN